MDSKLIGSVLLIIGTSIGAGMLALPIATAQIGFLGAIILLVACWLLMTSGAFLLLEVNLWLPTNSNIISMARATIGPIGQVIAWIAYLLLLYSLLCAYIAGGSDLFYFLLQSTGLHWPHWVAAILFTIIFAILVYLGMHIVDYTNRGLMAIKFSAFFILIFLLTPYISMTKITDGNVLKITSIAAIMVTITSFGYAPIIPSLRIYFAGDVKRLKKAIYLGSLIPLLCYIAWDAVVMGVIPLAGQGGLIEIFHSTTSNSDLVRAIVSTVHSERIDFFFKLFTSICVLTSFLGVSLCLTDFLADGLHLDKEGYSNVLIHLLTYAPPLVIVLFFPGIFIQALEYAGIYCVVLLVLLPAWMCWCGRYKTKIAQGFKVQGGKVLLILLMVISFILIIYEMLNFGAF